jgi:hypothetical protein
MSIATPGNASSVELNNLKLFPLTENNSPSINRRLAGICERGVRSNKKGNIKNCNEVEKIVTIT